jgi:hypothetical protein
MEIWKSLKRTLQSVAEERLQEHVTNARLWAWLAGRIGP